MKNRRRPRPSLRGLGRLPSRLHSLLDSVDVVVWEAQASSLKRTFVSRHAERLFGYPRRRWLAEAGFWQNHIHPEDRRRTVSGVREHLASGSPTALILKYRFLAADGRIVFIRDISRIVPGLGLASRLCGVMVDVSDWHRRSYIDRRARRSDVRRRLIPRKLVRLPTGRRLSALRRARR